MADLVYVLKNHRIIFHIAKFCST